MSSISRRRLLRRGCSAAITIGSGVSLPAIWPHSVLGASERLSLGLIGCGNQGSFDARQLVRTRSVDCVALCDAYLPHVEAARRAIGVSPGCQSVQDFRRVLDRGDVDVIVIATPDHWHGPIAIAACRAGKDIYCETPLTRTIAEGRALVRAVERYGTILQAGSRGRSSASSRLARALIRSGRLGKIQRVETHVGRNPSGRRAPDRDPPAGLDWNLYLGPAPLAPFNPLRFKWNFRWCSDYAGGNLTDRGAQYNDLAQWALGLDRSGPVRIRGRGRYPRTGIFDAPVDYSIRYDYDSGVEIICDDRGEGVTFRGSQGVLHLGQDRLVTEPAELLRAPLEPGSRPSGPSRNHYLDFLAAVRSRERPLSDVETAHRSATLCHLGNISIESGREIRWDPDREQILDDDVARRLLERPMRGPWQP